MAAPSNNKPQQPELPPLIVPPAPTVAVPLRQNFWLHPAPAVDVRSGFHIILPDPPAQSENWNWKQPPTAEEKQSISDEIWK